MTHSLWEGLPNAVDTSVLLMPLCPCCSWDLRRGPGAEGRGEERVLAMLAMITGVAKERMGAAMLNGLYTGG